MAFKWFWQKNKDKKETEELNTAPEAMTPGQIMPKLQMKPAGMPKRTKTQNRLQEMPELRKPESWCQEMPEQRMSMMKGQDRKTIKQPLLQQNPLRRPKLTKSPLR